MGKVDPQLAAAKTYLRGSVAELGVVCEFEKHVAIITDKMNEAKLMGDKDHAAFLMALQYVALGAQDEI